MLQGKIRWLCLHSMEAPGEQNTGGRHLRCGTVLDQIKGQLPSSRLHWLLLTSHAPPSSSVFLYWEVSKFLFTPTFYEKGVWISAWTTVESSLACFVCLPSLTAVSKLKLGILSLRAIFIFTSLPLNIYKSFGERIKPLILKDEWLNLDSDGIKWANRNSWQKLYDGEVITCRLLPHCRRWEWSAGLVYRSNCMTQFRVFRLTFEDSAFLYFLIFQVCPHLGFQRCLVKVFCLSNDGAIIRCFVHVELNVWYQTRSRAGQQCSLAHCIQKLLLTRTLYCQKITSKIPDVTGFR